jgi:hypothetical protein
MSNTKIRELNDAFRTTFEGGQVLITPGISALQCLEAIMTKVQTYDDFNAGNDPHEEHDFGALDHAGHKIFWKIDYYDPDTVWGSANPADPAVTTRVLTVFLASEY